LTAAGAARGAALAQTCAALHRAWADALASAVSAVDVGCAGDAASAGRLLRRLPRLAALTVRDFRGHNLGASDESTAFGGVLADGVRRDDGVPGGVTAFAFHGIHLPAALVRSLSSPLAAAALRRLTVVAPESAPAVVAPLIKAVGPQLTDLTLTVEKDADAVLVPLVNYLDGVGVALRRLALNFTVQIGARDMQFLADHCPALEALTLLGSVLFHCASGRSLSTGGLFPTDALALIDLMDDAALGVVAGMGHLRELVIAACVEDWAGERPADGVPVTASPSPPAIGAALERMAPRLRRFALASCAAPDELLVHLPEALPALTGLRLDWSTVVPDGGAVPVPPLVRALATPGRLPALTDLALAFPAGVDFGGAATVAALNHLCGVARLRVALVGGGATALLAGVALLALVDLRVATGGGALVGCAADLRRRCPALAALTVRGAVVDLGFAQGVAGAAVDTTFVACVLHPRVDHPWLRHERALRFVACTEDRRGEKLRNAMRD